MPIASPAATSLPMAAKTREGEPMPSTFFAALESPPMSPLSLSVTQCQAAEMPLRSPATMSLPTS
jgi:hypothetical protein